MFAKVSNTELTKKHTVVVHWTSHVACLPLQFFAISTFDGCEQVIQLEMFR